MNICLAGAELLHADRQTDRQIYRQTDGGKNSHGKLKVDFHSFAHAPKNPFLQTPLKTKIILSCVNISSSYRAVNTPLLGYKNQKVSAM